MDQNNNLIFVVEDDVPCGMLIKYYLKKNNFENVILFTNENDCLNSMARQPDILITDYRLRSTDGISLIRKAKLINSDLSCILLSGLSFDEIFENNDNMQFVDKYIRKSLTSMNELVNMLDHYLVKQYL
jgi:DNA-binding response OmpR family regulator